MSFEFLISKIQKNNFLLIGRAGVDIYPDPPGTKSENAKSFVTHLGGSAAIMGVTSGVDILRVHDVKETLSAVNTVNFL